jgi:hypothetical protein
LSQNWPTVQWSLLGFIGILFKQVETSGPWCKKGPSTAEQAMTMQTLTAVSSSSDVIPILTSLGVTSAVFLSGLGILLGLKRLGGRFTANVQASGEAHGNRIAVTAQGVVGTYLAIVIFEYVGLYLILLMQQRMIAR